jgi:hypothetical protein
MSRSFTVDRHHRALAATLFVAFMLLLGGQSPAAEPGPSIANGTVTPGSLPHTGGWVEITADVTDEDGVEAVNVELRGSDGSTFGVLMTGFGDHYSGSVELPANFWELPSQYTVWISAGDDSGAFASEQIGDVTVEAAPPFDEAP